MNNKTTTKAKPKQQHKYTCVCAICGVGGGIMDCISDSTHNYDICDECGIRYKTKELFRMLENKKQKEHAHVN